MFNISLTIIFLCLKSRGDLFLRSVLNAFFCVYTMNANRRLYGIKIYQIQTILDYLVFAQNISILQSSDEFFVKISKHRREL